MQYLIGPVSFHTALIENKRLILVSDIHDKNITLNVEKCLVCSDVCKCKYVNVVEYISGFILNNNLVDVFVETPYNRKPYENNILNNHKNYGMLRTIVESFEIYFYNNKVIKYPNSRFHAIDIRYNTNFEFCEPLTKLFNSLKSSYIETDTKVVLSYLLSQTLFPNPEKDFFHTPLGAYYKLLIFSNNVIDDYNRWKDTLDDIDNSIRMLKYKLGAYHRRTGEHPQYMEVIDSAVTKYYEFFENIDHFTSTRGRNIYHKIALQLCNLSHGENIAITEYFTKKLQTLWSTGNLFVYYKSLWDSWNTMIEGVNQINYHDIDNLLNRNNPGLEFGSVLQDIYTIARMLRMSTNKIIVAGRSHIHSIKEFLISHYNTTFATYECRRIRDVNLIEL